ncbi:MAG: GTPase Era [Candidatus Saelkia tenebricola]|nr:GTPase Era [Candidatus Saelkia tenebricola]
MDPKSVNKNSLKSGFVAVVGKPNVGKSTLINNLLGEKVSIVSSKPKTTRNKILAILTGDSHQVIFVDTPGIHKSKYLLDKYMLKEAESSLGDTDIVIVMLDASRGITTEDRYIFELLAFSKKSKFLVLNKIDLISNLEILPLLDEVSKTCKFDEHIPISALKNRNLDRLLEQIIKYLPEGDFYYPDDQLTDKSLRFHAQEMIRERVLENTYMEVPYSVAVVVEEFKKAAKKKGMVVIEATIYVERDTQKGILIGHNGSMLKKVGTEARLEIEKFLDKKVFLELRVKVSEKWRKDGFALRRFGYA